jgi:hypothetical protein
MSIARKLYCDFNDAICTDGRCKIGYCAAEHAHQFENSRLARSESIRLKHHQRPLVKEAKKRAREICRERKIQPTRENLEKLMKSPAVLAEAQRRANFSLDSLPRETQRAILTMVRAKLISK